MIAISHFVRLTRTGIAWMHTEVDRIVTTNGDVVFGAQMTDEIERTHEFDTAYDWCLLAAFE